MSTTKITSLTAEQQALIPKYVEEFRVIGLNTSPCNRQRAEQAVKRAYTYLGKTEPKTIIWLDSPRQGALAAALLSGNKMSGDQLGRQLGGFGLCCAFMGLCCTLTRISLFSAA